MLALRLAANTPVTPTEVTVTNGMATWVEVALFPEMPAAVVGRARRPRSSAPPETMSVRRACAHNLEVVALRAKAAAPDRRHAPAPKPPRQPSVWVRRRIARQADLTARGHTLLAQAGKLAAHVTAAEAGQRVEQLAARARRGDSGAADALPVWVLVAWGSRLARRVADGQPEDVVAAAAAAVVDLVTRSVPVWDPRRSTLAAMTRRVGWVAARRVVTRWAS